MRVPSTARGWSDPAGARRWAGGGAGSPRRGGWGDRPGRGWRCGAAAGHKGCPTCAAQRNVPGDRDQMLDGQV